MVSEKMIPNINEIMPIAMACSQVSRTIAVGLLGPHVAGEAKQYSDWDLGVTSGMRGLTAKEFLSIQRIVEESREDLPRNVHVINLDMATTSFLNKINYVPQFLLGDPASWAYFMGVQQGIHKGA